VSEFTLIRLGFDELRPSPGFAEWLAAEQVTIALTKGGSLWLVGLDEAGALRCTEQQFGMCQGLYAIDSQTLLLATRYQIWRLQNALPSGQQTPEGDDRLYLPQTAWTTGTLLVRDLAQNQAGELVFVNGRYSCLSKPSRRLNFDPVWLPPFVSELEPEERCYLSGLCLDDGRPAWVTSASRSNEPDGWREHQRDGGVVMSVPSGEPIATGLSMPSSPVLADGRLWVCLGGSGELAAIDLADGTVARVAELPGFARGLALRGSYAVVGTSRPQRGERFSGLPLADRLPADDPEGRCGISVVDLESGEIQHWLTLVGGSPEIGAVALLPGVRSASAVAFNGDDAQELVTAPGLGS
jgi:uncharacterized protein (TIGR03032 family)